MLEAGTLIIPLALPLPDDNFVVFMALLPIQALAFKIMFMSGLCKIQSGCVGKATTIMELCIA